MGCSRKDSIKSPKVINGLWFRRVSAIVTMIAVIVFTTMLIVTASKSGGDNAVSI